MTENVNPDVPKSHWDELAEQLGLPTASLPPSSADQTASPPPVIEPATPSRAVAAKERAPRPVEPEVERPFGEGLWDEESAPEASGASSAMEDPSAKVESAASGEADENAGVEEKSSPREGRRGRRGGARRGGRGRSGEGSRASDGEGSRERGESTRGRGRPRRGSPRDDEETPSEEPEAAEPESVHPAYEDDETLAESFANWNVPSWNDLIGSLYRPER